MLISRISYLIFFNIIILLSICISFLGIDNIEYIIGWLITLFIFIYYCYGNIFLVTRNKLLNRFPCGIMKLRPYYDDGGNYVKKLYINIPYYNDVWYELDISMFGFIGSDKMSIKYYRDNIMLLSDSEDLYKLSERNLSVRRLYNSYQGYKSELLVIRILYSIFFILFSIIFFYFIYILLRYDRIS